MMYRVDLGIYEIQYFCMKPKCLGIFETKREARRFKRNSGPLPKNFIKRKIEEKKRRKSATRPLLSRQGQINFDTTQNIIYNKSDTIDIDFYKSAPFQGCYKCGLSFTNTMTHRHKNEPVETVHTDVFHINTSANMTIIFTRDHWIPRSKSGKYLIPLCASCNQSKRSKIIKAPYKNYKYVTLRMHQLSQEYLDDHP